MDEHLLENIALVVVLGVGAQWLAWRIKLPSILLLLLAGLVAGPLLGVVKPDVLLGATLMPVVSIFVGLILFEGGLTLDIKDFSHTSTVIKRLLTVGVLITWLGSALTAFLVFDISPSFALLMGRLVIVTGPTVIGPMR